jgi:glycosyltransferase involved in cell wall biosynthesis
MTADKPHLLYVAWGYPPCRGGGVYRALATANRFVDMGWRVTVLTADRETFIRYTGADSMLEDRVDASIRVVRVPFRWAIHDTNLRHWSFLRAASPALWRRLRVKLDQVAFPEVGYGPWRRALERVALELQADDPFDLVVATANPHVAFTAAWTLNRKHGVPYVMDYRDAWTLDVFDGSRPHGPYSRAARWERRMLAQAREVWFVNEPIRAWHAATYPAFGSRMYVVANGYDTELAPNTAHRAPRRDRPLVLGYLGTVSNRVPLAEFLAGWRLARARSALLSDAEVHIHGYLGYYATPRADLTEVIAEHAAEHVSYLGPVGKMEIHDVYDSFDIGLLILGTGRYVTSGKVYEYIASGLPIVSVHDPGNAASDVLRGYPRWFPVADLSAESITEALEAAAADARNSDGTLRERTRMFAEQYSRERQLDPRIGALTASISDQITVGLPGEAA